MLRFVYCYGIPAIQFVYVRDSAKIIPFCNVQSVPYSTLSQASITHNQLIALYHS